MNRLFDHEKPEVYQVRLPRSLPFFDIARGSVLECGAGLDVLVAKGLCESTGVAPGKERLRSIVSMLVGLIKANSDFRLHEGA